MTTDKRSKSVLFQTPDGQPWIASYNNNGEIICSMVGHAKQYKFEELRKQNESLMDRIKKELDGTSENS